MGIAHPPLYLLRRRYARWLRLSSGLTHFLPCGKAFRLQRGLDPNASHLHWRWGLSPESLRTRCANSAGGSNGLRTNISNMHHIGFYGQGTPEDLWSNHKNKRCKFACLWPKCLFHSANIALACPPNPSASLLLPRIAMGVAPPPAIALRSTLYSALIKANQTHYELH